MMRAKKNISKIVLNINLAEDKGLFEPYVFNDTRAVLRRVQGSNPLFLSDNETELCVGYRISKEANAVCSRKTAGKMGI